MAQARCKLHRDISPLLRLDNRADNLGRHGSLNEFPAGGLLEMDLQVQVDLQHVHQLLANEAAQGGRTLFAKNLADLLANLRFLFTGSLGPGGGNGKVVELPVRIGERDVRIEP